MEERKSETLCIHGGYQPKSGEPFELPIAQSTTYKYDTTEQLAELFNLQAPGHIYTRISNPTVAAFEDKMAALEGGVAALALSSGMSAITITTLNLCKAGDSIVASRSLYGGSLNLFGVTLKRLGIEVIYVDPNPSKEALTKAIKSNTKMLFAETIANPMLEIIDFETWSQVAESEGIPLVVDNSLATPLLCKPLEQGAHIVVYSASKYVDGHRSCIGGTIVDGGTFPWDNGKFPQFTEADESYHGTRFFHDYNPMGFIVRARAVLLRDTGCAMSPFNAFFLHNTLETLHLRMKQHSKNGLAVAEFLENNPKVQWVNYPGLKSSTEHKRAERYMPKGCGGVVTFGVVGGAEKASRLVESFKLISHVTHVAANTSMVLHPASTTHRQLSNEQLEALGIGPELIRLSIGIEHTEDILQDLAQAFASI